MYLNLFMFNPLLRVPALKTQSNVARVDEVHMVFTHTIQSTASMRDRSLVGRPIASRMMAMVMMPPAGMPAAPTLEAVAVTLEITRNNHLNDGLLPETERTESRPLGFAGNCENKSMDGSFSCVFSSLKAERQRENVLSSPALTGW